MCLTTKGNIFVWGSKIKEEKQFNSEVEDRKIVKIACGGSFEGTSFAFLTNDGRVYTWGSGKKGQLGHGDYKDISSPKLILALSN